MLLLLLSFIILVAQGFLGMADWWVLGSNWLVAGLISVALTAVLNNQGLVAFSNISVSIKTWVFLASVMNLSDIHLFNTLSHFRMDMTAIGFAGLFMAGFFCWQKRSMPIRSLSMGAAIGFLSLFYAPSLIWLIIPVLFLFHCSCWSKHNLACVLTGMLSVVWVNYCMLDLCSSDQRANEYIFSFAEKLKDLSYQFPTIITDGYTSIIFLASMVMLSVTYVVLGLFSTTFNSLRMRCNVSLQCTVSVLLILLLPLNWQLYLILIGVSNCMHMMLSLGNQPTRMVKKWSHLAIYFFMFLGIGEYLIRLTIDYVSSISFTLPFEIPFLN